MIWFGHEVRRCQVTGSGGRRQRLLRVLAGIPLVSATAVGNRREGVADSSEGQSPGAYRGQEYTKLKVTNTVNHFLRCFPPSTSGHYSRACLQVSPLPCHVFALRLCLSTSWSLESANAAGTLTKPAS
jgi:hypothetical protein